MCLCLHAWSNNWLVLWRLELRCLEVKLPTKFNTDGGMIYGIPMVARDGTILYDTS